MVGAQLNIDQKIRRMLDETPGQSIIGLSARLKVNRTYLAGYLHALEDHKEVSSRKIGTAKVYYNGNKKGAVM